MTTETSESTQQALRATSDAFVARLANIQDLEGRKRELAPVDPTFMELADQVEQAVGQLLEHSREQRRLSLEAHDEAQTVPIERIPAGLSAAALLDRWRSAEREAGALTPGTPEALGARMNVEAHRRAYNKIYGTRRQNPPEG